MDALIIVVAFLVMTAPMALILIAMLAFGGSGSGPVQQATYQPMQLLMERTARQKAEQRAVETRLAA